MISLIPFCHIFPLQYYSFSPHVLLSTFAAHRNCLFLTCVVGTKVPACYVTEFLNPKKITYRYNLYIDVHDLATIYS